MRNVYVIEFVTENQYVVSPDPNSLNGSYGLVFLVQRPIESSNTGSDSNSKYNWLALDFRSHSNTYKVICLQQK